MVALIHPQIMKLFVIFVCALVSKFSGTLTEDVSYDIDNFNIVDYVHYHGYSIEVHRDIQTADGYLLTLHRILPKSGSESARTPVFLMHGLFGNAENWVIAGPDSALAFQLANRGHDVWIGNSRGSLHSRKHIRLDPDIDSRFWDFSWHETGVYDLPAMLDHVMNVTKQNELFYVGHSQGTTEGFVLCAELPRYCKEHLKALIMLSPIAYMGHVPQPFLKIMSNILGTGMGLSFVSKLFGLDEFLPSRGFTKQAEQIFCSQKSITNKLCENLIFLVNGYDTSEINQTMVSLIASTSMSPSIATKQLVHYDQLIRSGKFQKFDHGITVNIEEYGDPEPPEYNLQNIETPVAIFYSMNDFFLSVEDAEELYDNLPVRISKYLVPFRLFSHLDFVFAKDTVPLVYSKVFVIFDKIENSVETDKIDAYVY